MARNPACSLLKSLTMAGVSPARVMSAVYGEPSREGQSPFALGVGNQFEAGLFESGAARLLELYQTAGRLPLADCRVVDVPRLAPGTSRAAMERRHTLSDQLLWRKLAGDPSAPNLIVKPRLVVGLLGLHFNIEPDALVAADGDAFYTPIEIKSYPDRDGKTEPADVRAACRQAAVAVVALREAARRFGVTTLEQQVPARGDLVLRVPGSLRATLRPMTLAGEVDSLVRALAAAPRDLDEAEALLAAISPAATLDDPTVLDQIPTNYRESCREFCALARRCKERAVCAGDPVLLGSRAREEYAAAGTLGRVLELLEGHGAPPRSPAERRLQAQLHDAHRELRLAI
jgi:hypothetical protein